MDEFLNCGWSRRVILSFLAARNGIAALWLALALGGAFSTAGAPLSTAFTYQGWLELSGAATNGTFDFQFQLYDASEFGTQIGPTVEVEDVITTDGLFVAEIDFGDQAFGADARWLEIAVRVGASTGAYTLLTPRQSVSPTPYAVRASSSGNSDTLEGLPAATFLQSDGSVVAEQLTVTGEVLANSIRFPDGTVQITASTSGPPTVTHPEAHTSAFLTCGIGAESNPVQWAAVADGRFRLIVDGAIYGISASFVGVDSMPSVAAIVEGVIRAATSGAETVTWDSDHFIIRSGNMTSASSIAPLETHDSGLGIDISGAGTDPWMDCDAGSSSVTSAALDLPFYEDHIALLDSSGRIDPHFVVPPVLRSASGTASNQSGGQTNESILEEIALGWRPRMVLLTGRVHARAFGRDRAAKGSIWFTANGYAGGMFVSFGDSIFFGDGAFGLSVLNISYSDVGIGCSISVSAVDFTGEGFSIQTDIGTGNQGGGACDSSQIRWLAVE